MMQKKQIPANRKPTIYWEDLRQGYNDKHDTNFITTAEFLSTLYSTYRSIQRCSDVLGVSHMTLYKKMKLLGLPLLPKGHRGVSRSLRALQDLDDVSKLSCKEIAEKIGYSVSRTRYLLVKNSIPYRKIKKSGNTWIIESYVKVKWENLMPRRAMVTRIH